jgi:Zn-dependent protease with chaperone function
MNFTPGIWYDGKVSLRREVTLTCGDDRSVRVSGDGIDFTVPLDHVTLDPCPGAAHGILRFPGGGVAEVADDVFVSELQRLQGKGSFFRFVKLWESSLGRAFLALIMMLLVGFSFTRYAVPALATRAAFALPASTEEMIGRETLQVMDRMVLQPSKLPKQRRREVTALFSAVKLRYPERRNWQLLFRSGEKVGANAFALPAGKIVITDQLVILARNDREIAAVLAHEIGHLKGRHALRQLMQNSATALLVATVTGDITSFSATLPTLLLDAKFSRDFEMEADDAAVEYLKKEGIPVRVYADLLTRLGEDRSLAGKHKESRFGEIFSDHPAISERVRRVMSAGK